MKTRGATCGVIRDWRNKYGIHGYVYSKPHFDFIDGQYSRLVKACKYCRVIDRSLSYQFNTLALAADIDIHRDLTCSTKVHGIGCRNLLKRLCYSSTMCMFCPASPRKHRSQQYTISVWMQKTVNTGLLNYARPAKHHIYALQKKH